MRCDDAQARVSAALDHGPAPGTDVDEHVRTCPNCRVFLRQSARIRQHLRYEVVEAVPDVAPRVRAAVTNVAVTRARRRSPAWLAAAAALLVGAVVGAAVVGFGADREPDTAAANLSAEVLDAQHDVHSLIAGVEVVERGWHADVATRTYHGQLAYRAPESLAVNLVDETAYPSMAWVPNDVTVVVNEDSSWASGPAGCPRELLPACTPRAPRVWAVTEREPFSEAMPAPLDLIVPVVSFEGSAETTVIATGERAGRDAQLVEVSAAQAEPLLAVLRQAGNWREVHPTDRVQIWLDDETLVPLELNVFASTDPNRADWAARLGYSDDPDVPILELRLTDVAINDEPAPDAFPLVPADAVLQNQGFRDLPVRETGIPRPDGLPDGMNSHRAGAIETAGGPSVFVRSWSDGRAWVTVRVTREWSGGRLFGDVGEPVRAVTLVGGGAAYVGPGGTRVGIHGGDDQGLVDAVVAGSLAEGDLVQIAAGLGIEGQPAPPEWPEAGTASLADAEAALPGLLLPVSPEGFEAPGIRIGPDGLVELAYDGPGARSFVLVEAPGTSLAASLEGDAHGVALRDTTARYSPGRGELEWVENDLVISLRSDALTVAELVALAEELDTA
jgi:predicted anti-sigma-YlaC factor YlaD